MALLGAADGHVGVHDVVLLDGAEASREAVTSGKLGPGLMPGQAHGEEEGGQSHVQCSVSEGNVSQTNKMRPYLYSQTFTDIKDKDKSWIKKVTNSA